MCAFLELFFSGAHVRGGPSAPGSVEVASRARDPTRVPRPREGGGGRSRGRRAPGPLPRRPESRLSPAGPARRSPGGAGRVPAGGAARPRAPPTAPGGGAYASRDGAPSGERPARPEEARAATRRARCWSRPAARALRTRGAHRPRPLARGSGLAGSGSGLNMDEDGGGGEGGGGECRRCGRPGLAAWGGGRGRAGRERGGGSGVGGPGSARAGWRQARPAARRPGAQRRGAGGVASEPERGSGARPGSLAAGVARGLGQGAGVALPGRGTLGATFPASRRQGRSRPPEPDRRRLTSPSPPFGVSSQVVGSGVSPRNGEGKVPNWGSSGSKRGGWRDKVESRVPVCRALGHKWCVGRLQRGVGSRGTGIL